MKSTKVPLDHSIVCQVKVNVEFKNDFYNLPQIFATNMATKETLHDTCDRSINR